MPIYILLSIDKHTPDLHSSVPVTASIIPTSYKETICMEMEGTGDLATISVEALGSCLYHREASSRGIQCGQFELHAQGAGEELQW